MLVITGGPGAGKTTLINKLSERGFTCFPESGRTILQSKIGHEIRDRDPLAYAVAMLDRDEKNFDMAASEQQKYAFDRGFPDIMGYLNLIGVAVPDRLKLVCQRKRYSGPIFGAPPWKEIYVNDDERTQDFTTACETYDSVFEAWTSNGYEVVSLPLTTVDERIKFILERTN